ncbi:MAG TPA: protein kinase [Ktedonobacteraceae bacterium]|nr:protein kinase [Ktedonobacteraceae bacterium]
MQMLHEDQLTGKILGAYQIERLIGHGQLSAVYLARHQSQGHTVMVTVFNYPSDGALRSQYAALFARESAALVGLQHPHILPTYDYGEQDGFPYLVTAYVKGASLTQALKQQQRFTVQQTLNVFKQLASGLDEAHSKGITHGILSLSNVLMSNELVVQIAGFGLKTILEIQANTQSRQPQAHLFSASGTFLGNPAYISPERVMGMPVDARSDIYALGIMLFEMLSGKLPFQGANSLETALMRIQYPVPSLHKVAPDVPPSFDLLINKILERDPARRYQRASEVSTAFERVTKMLDASNQAGAAPGTRAAQDPQITLPPTINWFDEDEDRLSSGKWQLMPPIITGHLPAVSSSAPSNTTEQIPTHSRPAQTGALQNSPTGTTSAKMPAVAPVNQHADSVSGIDPFAWWAGKTAKAQPPTPGTFAQRPPVRLSNTRSRRQPSLQDRRKTIKLIAAGGAAAGVLAVGGISFAHFAQSLRHSQASATAAPKTANSATQTAPGHTPTTAPTHVTQTTPTPKPSPTKAAQPTPTAHPTQQPTPKPTQPPPTPTQPPHTGTVIGHTNMSNNSSNGFNNPADGQGSLLIRLANGNFVACEKACTHEGVAVYYDAGQQQLVCPAHGAIFDPINGFAHLSGPGNGPLATVKISINADGTITTG